jgi:hypothetical protein
MPSPKKPVKKARSAVTNRTRTIDAAVENAQRKKKKKVAAPKKNPYPKGSARAKMWARRQKEKK